MMTKRGNQQIRMTNSNAQTRLVLTRAGAVVGVQAILTGVAILSMLDKDVFGWPWWPAIIGALIAFAIAVTIIVSGLFVHRALYLYVFSSLAPMGWIMVLLAPSFAETGTSAFQFSLDLFFFLGVTIVVYFHLTTNELAQIKVVPMLNQAHGRWDLSKSYERPEHKARMESLKRVLLPLGPLIGILLYQTGDPAGIADAILPFLACLLGSVTGINMAIAAYLLHTERMTGKNIRV
jgi:hypothetical protein